MTVTDVLDMLAKLGPLAREHGIESVEAEGVSVKFFRVPPQMVAVPLAKPKSDEPPKPRPTFAGRDADEIRAALGETS